tara:strand:+ start:181 stop:408 length:228 start_codon:yes stop_codon:yes gene_type:complete
MAKFQKPFISRPEILNPKIGDPLGYVSNDGMWAAVPLGNTKKFVIIHNGSQEKICNNYKQSMDYIKRKTKLKNKK